MPIITSLLDTDLYKLTMQQIALHRFPTMNVEYTFKCRNEAKWTPEEIDIINYQVNEYCKLKYTQDELDYLSTFSFFKDDFIDFLKIYQPNRDHIKIWLEDDELKITVKGPWYLTVPFEVPVLAIVNETYFHFKIVNMDDAQERLVNKVIIANKYGFPFADFGTRRRYSCEWQKDVVEYLSKECPNFIGTSNVYLAMGYGLKPIGTMAHEYIMAGAGLDEQGVNLPDSQTYMLNHWDAEYGDELGIALTDTYGIDAFTSDFNTYLSERYNGIRHDSGDPYAWTYKMIKHYTSKGIDIKTKAFVYSDGLTMQSAADLWTHFRRLKLKQSFGIGTHLTNDFEHEALQIVMKLTKCNGLPVAKISDSPGKGMCHDEEYLKRVKKVFLIK